MKCSDCEIQPNLSSNLNWKLILCQICGRKPKSEKELRKWIDGVCIKCQSISKEVR